MTGRVRFKVADARSESEQIFRLSYDTFVEEIPQHPVNDARRHVDRFHDQNTYLIALEGDDVVGMMAVRAERPFSLDEKLGGVDPYLPPDRRVCELRLLAVKPAYRRGTVFRGLIDLLLAHGRAQGYDLAIISGTLRQAKLYRHLGFTPFGPLVGTAEAPFQPMFITIEHFEETTPVLAGPRRRAVSLSFLPGPVSIAADVRDALAAPPVSHRDARFLDAYRRAADRLCALTAAARAEILVGSATLANDVIGGQIALRDEPGLVVANGEFGERLIDHARRFQMTFTAVEHAWGEPIDWRRVEDAAIRTSARWLWAVVGETSTGMLNDLERMKACASRHALALYVDAVSAIGAVPLDLRGVELASAASGKALAAFPGLAIVFHRDQPAPAPTRLPRYLDLGHYIAHAGVPFTHSSNLVAALNVALDRFDAASPMTALADASRRLRWRLREMGITILVDDAHALASIVTVVPPAGSDAVAIGDDLARRGFLVAYRSDYLVRRNWLQISLMGQAATSDVASLLDALGAVMPVTSRAAAKRA